MRGLEYVLESFPFGVSFVKGQGFNEGVYSNKKQAWAGYRFFIKTFPKKSCAVFDNAGLVLWSVK